MNINIITAPLEPCIKAVTTPNEDGTYTIIVNNHLSQQQAIKAILHELAHIDGDDFTAEEHANILEKMVREKNRPYNLDRFTFFYHAV